MQVADIWFRCCGVVPNSDYLGDELASARRSDGFIEVGPALQVAGQTTVFAVGDISTSTRWPRDDPTFPGQDQIVGRETVSQVKGRDLMVDSSASSSGWRRRPPPDRSGQPAINSGNTGSEETK
jgi:hypothetical protein